MSALSVFYPWVALDCPGVPTSLMDDAIRRGCREFCKAASVYEPDVTITTIISTADYAPTLPTATEIISVLSIKRSATEALTAKSQEFIDAQSAESGDPWAYAVLMEQNPLKVRFYPTPESVESLTAKFSLMPTSTATTVDARFFDWYLEGVTAYAKYWLFRTSNQSWSSATEAETWYDRFYTQVGTAVISRQQQKARVPTQVKMRPFA